MTQGPSTTKDALQHRGALSINFSIAVRVSGTFSLEQLQQALDRVRVRHKVLIPNGDFHFPLRCVTSKDDNAWQEVVKEELCTSFQNDCKAFARFTWVHSQDHSDLIHRTATLVGTFHHGVCDGYSGFYVMRDVLQLLGNSTASLLPFSPPPHISTLIPESVKANPLVKRRLRMIVMMTRLHLWIKRLRARFVSKPQPVAIKDDLSAPGALPPNLRMCILTKTLTDSQTKQLAQRCKAEGTTVHAAVCTAWLRAFEDSLAAKAPRLRSVSSPVSLRNRLSQQIDETAGIFLSLVETSLDCKSGREFWGMAREFQSSFKRNATDENLFMMPLTFGAFSKAFSEAEMADAVRTLFSRPVKYDFSITNLGRLDFPKQIGPLQIESFHNLVNSSEHERTVNVNTFDGRMTLTFIFRESKMTPHAGEQLMRQAILQLQEASNW